MNLRTIIILALLILPASLQAQPNDSINKVDRYGKKQGHWIKKYSNGHIQYDGYFKDNQPTGTFRRFFENDTLRSILVFSEDGKTADASIYESNGYIASAGRFVNQIKEGKWSFFSSRIEGYLICEEQYSNNLKNGPSLKYYPDKTLAEKLNYSNDIRSGEWFQYYPNGKTFLKASYTDGKLQGEFEIFYADGKPRYVGYYKNDMRDGLWNIYNPNGSRKYSIEYVGGIAKNSDLYKHESDYLDSLELNKGKLSDPEKTGTIWQ
jgi:antitoxin component YwqK of YwqJK toxin-antitoxin module